ncbi:Undecaprenyl-phosphate galactosephosphotransferase [Labilithrix luteola]|uniref:Undecaprenyl-phosphate galactosephosphotransferase n=2 Tax=Labilithrix luteola TaxID=1391654 RepID=A0A0K1PY46_9BACT|nr:Undecaprenyl-phosphate galactosephosphotransferase [Labilithrix luteola]
MVRGDAEPQRTERDLGGELEMVTLSGSSTSYRRGVHITVRIVKRLVDVVGSTAGLVLTLPLYVPIVVAVLAESPGPIFYVQRRAGRLIDGPDGEPRWVEFDLYKIRSMTVDAERNSGAVVSTPGDPRITKVGRFLRATRLDEIPQFWNVLRGDMSLVGPRPERPELLRNLAMVIPFFEERTRGLKPGLTGLAQVSLGYTGAAIAGSDVAKLHDTLTNPFDIPEAEGALADDMRIKLGFDLGYAAALEDFWSYVRLEAWIIVQTPIVMAMSRGR